MCAGWLVQLPKTQEEQGMMKLSNRYDLQFMFVLPFAGELSSVITKTSALCFAGIKPAVFIQSV